MEHCFRSVELCSGRTYDLVQLEFFTNWKKEKMGQYLDDFILGYNRNVALDTEQQRNF